MPFAHIMHIRWCAQGKKRQFDSFDSHCEHLTILLSRSVSRSMSSTLSISETKNEIYRYICENSLALPLLMEF